MNVSTEKRLPAIAAWELEFVCLIAFPADPPFFMDQQWWQDLAGEQPADFASTRKKYVREDRGSFQGVDLSLTVDLHRVVWLARPVSELGDLPGQLPVLGPFREKVDWFVEMLSPWLANLCPPLRRLAFDGKLVQAATTQAQAFQVLASHLPAVKFDPNPNDFLLQINRRRKSSAVVDGLPLNRVSTWSKMNVALAVEPGTLFTWPESCYSALELDINSAPERTEILPPKLLPELFRELASLGVDIAERGDIPDGQ